MISLSPFEAAVYSSNRFQRAGWVIPLFVRFGCIGRNTLVDISGVSKDTAAKYLEDLAYLGIIIRQGLHDGYVLTSGGKQLVSALLLEQPTKVIDAEEAGKGLNSTFGGDDPKGLNSTFFKNLEEDSINLTIDSSSQDSREGLNSTFREGLLVAICNLFGATIGTEIHPAISDDDIIAWTAKGWMERSNFSVENGAVGMIYNKLKKGITAPLKWRMRYHTILPQQFFEDAGLVKFKCAICEIDLPDRQAFEKHTHEDVAGLEDVEDDSDDQEFTPDRVAADETACAPIGGGLTAEQAWQSVLARLRLEMPSASFDTWARDTRVVRYHGNALTIGARNAYTREWLDSRLRLTVEKLLAEILGRSVTVAFAVGEAVES